jgi:hypothetical protein
LGTPGFLPEEILRFRVNGLPTSGTASLMWQNDLTAHSVALDRLLYELYLPYTTR